MSGKQFAQLGFDIVHREAVGQQFLHDLAIGDEVYETNVLALNDMVEGEAN